MDPESSDSQGDISKSVYYFNISPYIYLRLDRHILIIKKLIDKNTTKQQWITKAIQEKLAKDNDDYNLPKGASLSIKLHKDLEDALQKRVDFVKKFRVSYSKKQLFVDAVLEKLDRDKIEVENMLQNSDLAEVETYKRHNKELKGENEMLKSELAKFHNNELQPAGLS